MSSTKADRAVDTAAEKLETFVRRASAHGGVESKLAQQLRDDPEFLRRLKPSLVRARLRGSAAPAEPAPAASPGPSPAEPPKAKRNGSGPSQLVVIGAAFALGLLAAKVIDWRGHAHPRR